MIPKSHLDIVGTVDRDVIDITYDIIGDRYGTDIFTGSTIKGRLDVNAMKAKKHLYDHIVYDSGNEQKFAAELNTNKDAAVYVKLPGGFYISMLVGHYTPDWAIAFYEGTVKHIYFVAETKVLCPPCRCA